jgi:tetratricopeptide (TPR) repeat protein
MPYWTYYLIWPLLAYGMQQPWLLAGVLLFFLLRRWIPDPGSLWRALSRAGALKRQVSLNAANLTARRDLALLYLDLLRPRAALRLVDQALARDPDDAELLYLRGLALHRVGKHEDALEPLVRAVEIRPSRRYGLPYMVAGDALFALGRTEEAIDAFERYAQATSSDVGIYTRLARAYAKAGERDAAHKAIHDAIDTWRQIPAGMRRRSFGRWLEAHWARVWLLHEPGAIVVAVMVTAGVAAGVRYSIPLVGDLARRATRPAQAVPSPEADAEQQRLYDGFARCGSQTTGDLAGKYEVDVTNAAELDDTRGYQAFEVKRDRIVSGTELVQEFCLTRTLDRSGDRLRAEAVWHEDVHDPGDASMVEVRFERQGDAYRFAFQPLGQPFDDDWLTLRRANP